MKYRFYVLYTIDNKIRGPMTLKDAVKMRENALTPAQILMLVVNEDGKEVK